ncbi:MAG: hypothetical protein HRU17_08270, partial [Polyangiaceae bacterium]|nr:hypothetical protein [Polyangiaceae bacterium]
LIEVMAATDREAYNERLWGGFDGGLSDASLDAPAEGNAVDAGVLDGQSFNEVSVSPDSSAEVDSSPGDSGTVDASEGGVPDATVGDGGTDGEASADAANDSGDSGI